MTPSELRSELLRATCRDTLVRELLMRGFAHDVRGAVMGVMGWVELAAMEGANVPEGLSRSLDRLNEVVSRYGEPGPSTALRVLALDGLLREVLGLGVEGEAPPVRVDPLRLVAALELAAPARVHLSVDDRSGRERLKLAAVGLDPQGVQLAMAPHHEALMRHAARRDRALGACLLRVVARSGEGELRGQPPDSLHLFLPLS